MEKGQKIVAVKCEDFLFFFVLYEDKVGISQFKIVLWTKKHFVQNFGSGN